MTFKGTEFEGALFLATTEVINTQKHENKAKWNAIERI